MEETDDDIFYQFSRNTNKLKMKTLYYLILAMISYILPIVIFGNISGYNLLYLSITICILILVANYKVVQNIKWISYIYPFLHGLFMSYFGVSILGITSKSSMFDIPSIIGFLPALFL